MSYWKQFHTQWQHLSADWEGAWPVDSYHVPSLWVTFFLIIFSFFQIIHNYLRGMWPLFFCWQHPVSWWMPGQADLRGIPMWHSWTRCFLPLVRVMVFSELVPFYLVQDKSSIHTSKVVSSATLRDYAVPHPPKSLNLKPIQTIWAAMGRDFSAVVISSLPKQLWHGGDYALQTEAI